MIKEDMISFAKMVIDDQKSVIERWENRVEPSLDADIAERVIATAKKEIEYHENVIELVITGKMKNGTP